jgi:hypothetical protein
MKNGKFLWSGAALRAAGIAVLALTVMFAACSNPAGGEGSGGGANKTALNAAIETAEAAKAGVLVNTNSGNVALGTYWATQTDLDTFNAAINTAKTVRDNTSASQPQVDGAVTTLNNAVADFNAAKQSGTLVLDWSALDAEIAAAKMARDGVIVAVNAAGAASGAKWVTQAQFDALQAKITAAETLTPTSQGVVDNAVADLNTALNTFNNAVNNNGQGSKTEGFNQTDFDSLKDMANTAKAGVVTSSLDGDDVPPADLWVTSAVMGELNVAIITAEAAALSDTAYQALFDVLTAFNEAKQPGATIDKTALNAAITNANAAKVDVEIAATQNEAPNGSVWVTQAQLDALDTAYQAAANAATKKAVEEATTALTAAISTFNSAKTSNGLGTAVNGVTITGIGAIYNNGATVRVGVAASKDVEAPADPPGLVQGTVTNGRLSVSLGTLSNGSYYVGFSSDGIIYFISKATVVFNGAMKNIAYDTVNFELYTHSLNLGEMDMPQGVTATLNEVILEMSGGELTAYDTAFKNFLRQEVSEMLGSAYVNLNFLDVAFYKNAACTQEFSGTEQVDSTTTIYTKFSLAALMEGGGGEGPGLSEYSITITGIPSLKPGAQYSLMLFTSNPPSEEPVAGNSGAISGTSMTIALYSMSSFNPAAPYYVVITTYIGEGEGSELLGQVISKGTVTFSGSTPSLFYTSDFAELGGGSSSSIGTVQINGISAGEGKEVTVYLSTDNPIQAPDAYGDGTILSGSVTVDLTSIGGTFNPTASYYVYLMISDDVPGMYVTNSASSFSSDIILNFSAFGTFTPPGGEPGGNK